MKYIAILVAVLLSSLGLIIVISEDHLNVKLEVFFLLMILATLWGIIACLAKIIEEIVNKEN